MSGHCELAELLHSKPRSGPAVSLLRTSASSPDVSGASEARRPDQGVFTGGDIS